MSPIITDDIASGAFITPQEVVDLIGRGSATDPGMILATDAACDICRTIAEQPFNAGTATVTLDGSGTDAMLLPYLPVTAASAVVVNGGTVTDYALNGNGILFRGTAGGGTWPVGRQNVSVTFSHGYETVDIPDDVRMVALSIASRLAVQGVASEESLGGVSVKYAVAATDLTAGELRILGKYRGIR